MSTTDPPNPDGDGGIQLSNHTHEFTSGGGAPTYVVYNGSIAFAFDTTQISAPGVTSSSLVIFIQADHLNGYEEEGWVSGLGRKLSHSASDLAEVILPAVWGGSSQYRPVYGQFKDDYILLKRDTNFYSGTNLTFAFLYWL